jgi:hypothetical protein
MIIFVPVLNMLIKKGGGNWPDETLATALLKREYRCYVHPAIAGEISQIL